MVKHVFTTKKKKGYFFFKWLMSTAIESKQRQDQEIPFTTR